MLKDAGGRVMEAGGWVMDAGTRTLPYLTLPYLTLPYLTFTFTFTFTFTLPHLTSPYLTLPYLTLPYLTLPHLTSPRSIVDQHIDYRTTKRTPTIVIIGLEIQIMLLQEKRHA